VYVSICIEEGTSTQHNAFKSYLCVGLYACKCLLLYCKVFVDPYIHIHILTYIYTYLQKKEPLHNTKHSSHIYMCACMHVNVCSCMHLQKTLKKLQKQILADKRFRLKMHEPFQYIYAHVCAVCLYIHIHTYTYIRLRIIHAYSPTPGPMFEGTKLKEKSSVAESQIYLSKECM
jgi:hypothetical protein